MQEATPTPEPDRPAGHAPSLRADLELAAAGDEAARRRIWDEHYQDVHDLVVAWFEARWQKQAGRGDLSIGATHIVHRLYERLHDRPAVFGAGATWFFRCFYTECARIFFDHLRRRRRHHADRVEMSSHGLAAAADADGLDTIQQVLAEIEAQDPRMGEIAWMKVLETVPDEANPDGVRGLQNQEVADRLGYSLRFVEERWRRAKLLLLARLE